MITSHLVEPILRQLDNEDRELVLRWRIWKMKWFPYRTAKLLGFDEETGTLKTGPWRWNRPDRWQKK